MGKVQYAAAYLRGGFEEVNLKRELLTFRASTKASVSLSSSSFPVKERRKEREREMALN